MVAWWTSRSIRAAATIASPRISPHCSKPRLLVTMIEPKPLDELVERLA